VHQDADDITVEHFVLVQEEVDVESFKVVRQITHPEMKRCSRWLAS